MEKEEQRFVAKFFWLKGWGSKKVYQELMNTLGDDAYELSQIKIWFQGFRTEDLSSSDIHRARRPLTLGPQGKAFLQKYLFASAGIIAQHFLTTISAAKKFFRENYG
jgi:hypothetical protein